MDSFSLHCFLSVAESKSFTKAALRVGRTQSAVTQQISNLEKMVGTRLFERGRAIHLTKDGEIFLPYALKIFSLSQEVIERFKHPELEGEVRFGVPEDFATFLLSDILVDFSRSHPRIFLNVDCDLTLHLYEKFRRGKLDIVLLKMISPIDFPQGLDIWEEPLAWVGNSEAIFQEKKPLPLVLSPEPCVYRSAAISSLEEGRVLSRIVYTSPSYAGIIAAVKANLGFTVLPIKMIPQELHAISSPLLPPLPKLHVTLLTQKKEDPSIQSMHDYLEMKLKQLNKTVEFYRR